MRRSLFCLLVLTVSLAVSTDFFAQKSEKRPDDQPLFILIGTVSSTSSLVRPDKLHGSVGTLPQPSEYLVGTLYKFRIDEVVRGNKALRSGQTIDVLVLGPGNVNHRVTLFPRHRYLLQLSSLTDVEKYKGMVVMDLAQPTAAQQPFKAQNVFTPVPDINNAVPVTEENRELIKRIKHEARNGISKA